MNRKTICFVSVLLFAAMVLLSVSDIHAQTSGKIPIFDHPGTGTCNSVGANDCIDSVITQDASGNIGIGTTTPAAKLDVTGGNVNLEDSTATAGNILKGGAPFVHNLGTNNTFMGKSTGNLTMTGIGFNAGFGTFALQSNTTGFGNAAFGANSLQFNTEGWNNSAFGAAALELNTTGLGNAGFGTGALYLNSQGSSNSGFGAQALNYNTTGNNNAAFGYNTMQGNISLGIAGNNNSAFGTSAMRNNATASDNSAFGFNALQANTTGNGNTAIGSGADVSTDNLTNATAIGYQAVVNANNKIRLGNSQVAEVEGPPYNTISDKNHKENFRSVDAEAVLGKIRGLSVTSWNYIGHDPTQFRHYGPVGQDFFAAFGHDGIGTIGSPTTISSVDMAGILMIAVQALEKRTAEQKKEFDVLRTENASLQTENAGLRARIEALERVASGAQTARSADR